MRNNSVVTRLSYFILTIIIAHLFLFPIMEAGHQILHALKSKWHSQHSTHSHSIKEHDVVNSDEQTNSLAMASIGFSFMGWLDEEPKQIIPDLYIEVIHSTATANFYRSRKDDPVNPPPGG